MIKVPLTETQEMQIGERLAKIWKLKRVGEPDRWQTTWGTKTNLGVCRMFLRIADDISAGDLSELLQ